MRVIGGLEGMVIGEMGVRVSRSVRVRGDDSGVRN